MKMRRLYFYPDGQSNGWHEDHSLSALMLDPKAGV